MRRQDEEQVVDIDSLPPELRAQYKAAMDSGDPAKIAELVGAFAVNEVVHDGNETRTLSVEIGAAEVGKTYAQ